jgi:hypothetical protein
MKCKHWTIGEEEENITHEALLGKGGYGEVHKVNLQRSLANFISSWLIWDRRR